MEIVLYDVVLPKLFCVQINFVKIVSSAIETIRPFVYILCVVIKPLIYIDINPRISLVSVVKKC